MGKLEPSFMKKKVDEADNLIEYMSHTIDDFRNFFMPKKEKELFSLHSSVQSVMNILGSMLKEHNIAVNINIDHSIMLNTYLNECEQVIVNIISNAKDALVSNKIQEARINIFALEDEHFVKLTIEDNGGGIQVQPKSKIFEPYFTTKDEANGTGIGLYMSKIIIEKNMKGKLRVKNINDGAQFSIFIPKK